MKTPKPNARQAVVVEHLLGLPLDVRFEPGHVEHACKLAGYANPKRSAKTILEQAPVRAALIARNTVVQEIEASINDAWVLGELATLWDTELKELFDEDGKLVPIHLLSKRAQKLIEGFEVSVGPDGVARPTKLKLINRFKVLDTIGRTTMVNAFGDKEKAEAAGSFSELLRALTVAAQNGEAIDIDQVHRYLNRGDD